MNAKAEMAEWLKDAQEKAERKKQEMLAEEMVAMLDSRSRLLLRYDDALSLLPGWVREYAHLMPCEWDGWPELRILPAGCVPIYIVASGWEEAAPAFHFMVDRTDYVRGWRSETMYLGDGDYDLPERAVDEFRKAVLWAMSALDVELTHYH